MQKEKYLEIRRQIPFLLRSSILFKHLLIDAGLIVVVSELSFLGRGLQFLAIPILSVFIFRNFALMHEASHGLVSQNKRVNDFIGILAGVFCGLPFEPWKKSHLHHHYWTGNYEKDPVMALISILPRWPKKMVSTISSLWNAWVPILAFMQNGLFWVLSIKTVIHSDRSKASLLSVFLPPVCLVLLLIFCSSNFLMTIFIPAVVLYLLAVDVVNLPHHLQLPMMNGENKLPLWEQHKSARTCLYPRWISAYITLNFNYHTEHHMYPDAPWYYLEKIHGAVQKQLGENQNLDPAFQWILENRPKSLLEVINPHSTAKNNDQVAS